MEYSPLRWYWLDATGRLYSSEARSLVQADDERYLAWRARGGKPTPWPRGEDGAQTNAALDAVLKPYGLAVA